VRDKNAEENQEAGHSVTGGTGERPQAEGIDAEKAHHSTESLEEMSSVELRQIVRDLKKQKIELEVQNAELLRNVSHAESLPDDQTILQLFEDYLRMYSSRDDRLTAEFSEDFSGFTGGGDFLVKDKAEWVAITRQDFAQVKDPIRIELKDLAIQSLADTIAVATGFFTIHLPIKDQILSHEPARLVLIFRKQVAGWKICHSSISIPYNLVGAGEIYPLKELTERNEFLERLVDERTNDLSTAIANLEKANAVAWAMFGAAAEEDFIGRSVLDFIVPEDRARALSRVGLRRDGAVIGPAEYRGRRFDGSTFDIEVNSEFIRDVEGSPTGMVVIVRDITDRKQAELEQAELKLRLVEHATELQRLNALLHEQALEDSLTGLPNRRQFTATLDREIRRARRNNGEISLLIADVDLFKLYNDTFGHQRGDECLRRVAHVLKATFRRPGELPARYGGEEFAVILPNCGSEFAVALAERLQRAMEEARIVHPSSGVAPYLTLSIGIASEHVRAGITAKVLIQAADNALYRSKAEGRNRVTASTVENQDLT